MQFQATNSQVCTCFMLELVSLVSQSTPPRCTTVIVFTDMCALVGAGRVEGKKRKESYTGSARSCAACFLDKISFNPHSNSITYTLSPLYRLGNREINHITNRGGTLTSKLLFFFFF